MSAFAKDVTRDFTTDILQMVVGGMVAATQKDRRAAPAATKKEIEAAQEELRRLGYYAQAVDGLFGPATRRAVATFQSDRGLVATGGLDFSTKWALSESSRLGRSGAASHEYVVRAPALPIPEDQPLFQSITRENPDAVPVETLRKLISQSNSAAMHVTLVAQPYDAEQLLLPVSVVMPAISRIFAGPKQYPPALYAGYGMVVFPTRFTSEKERLRHLMICQAYVGSLPHSNFDLRAIPKREQIVTVWPIVTVAYADEINRKLRHQLCPDAVEHYGLAEAIRVLRLLKQVGHNLNGKGPFLVAWSPANVTDFSQAKSISVPLSGIINSEQAERMMADWVSRIEQDPKVWESGETLDQLLSHFLDRWGDAGMQLIFGEAIAATPPK